MTAVVNTTGHCSGHNSSNLSQHWTRTPLLSGVATHILLCWKFNFLRWNLHQASITCGVLLLRRSRCFHTIYSNFMELYTKCNPVVYSLLVTKVNHFGYELRTVLFIILKCSGIIQNGSYLNLILMQLILLSYLVLSFKQSTKTNKTSGDFQ